MSGSATQVALVFVAQRINVYLRFGRPAGERIIDAQRRVASFTPGSAFCRIRWEANDYGTTRWQLAVMQAVGRSERMQRVAGVIPGAALLLHVEGATNVQAVLRIIDTIEAQGIAAADVAVGYWRVLHNRLAARAQVALYSADRHAAYRACQAMR